MIDDLQGLPTRLMIAIAAYTGQVTVQTQRTVITMLQCCGAMGIEAHVVTHQGCCYLDLTRNELVRQFLASDCDMLLMLDADVGAEPVALGKLLQAQKAVVAGLYPKKSLGMAWPVAFDPMGIKQTDKGLLEAVGVPTGFLLIHRAVFEALQPTVAAYCTDEGQQCHAYFETRIEHGRYWGEDFVFCNRWRALGGKVWVMPDIGFEHVGVKVWHGNYHQWYQDRPSWDKLPGWHHTPQLYDEAIAEASEGAHFVEVGVWKGRSTAYMAEHILHSKKRITFDVVDHFQGSRELQNDPDVQGGCLYEVFQANVAYVRDAIRYIVAKPSVRAARDYGDGALDWVFLDASHEAADVEADCAAWWPKVKHGGVLAGDDWPWESVQAGVMAYFNALKDDFFLESVGEGWRIRKPAKEG